MNNVVNQQAKLEEGDLRITLETLRNGKLFQYNQLIPASTNSIMNRAKAIGPIAVSMDEGLQERIYNATCSEFLQTPTLAQQHDAILWDFAREYYRRTEEYDLTICSGRSGPDGVMPATPDEMRLINRNAIQVRKDLDQQVQRKGYSIEKFSEVMKQLLRRPALLEEITTAASMAHGVRR